MSEHHAHDWRRTESPSGEQPWRCAECEATSATCGTCRRASGSSLLLCPSCERMAAGLLDDIEDALSHYRPDPRSLVSSPGDMRLVPGGGQAGGIDSPDDVISALLGWVARWTEHAGATNAAAGDYLRSHHMWAAHNPELSHWPAYLVAMRSLRHQARRIAGLLPKRLPEPCVHCGGQVVQDWTDKWWQPLDSGLSDVVRCLGCGMTWGDHARWLFSTRQHIVDLPSEHPDSRVTLAQARMIWPEVPAATWRQWAYRDRVAWEASVEAAQTWWAARQAHESGDWPSWEAAGWTAAMLDEAPDIHDRAARGERKGEAVYRVGHLAALVERRLDDARPGRPAA